MGNFVRTHEAAATAQLTQRLIREGDTLSTSRSNKMGTTACASQKQNTFLPLKA